MASFLLVAVLAIAGAGQIQEVDVLPDTMFGSERYTLDEAQDERARLVALASVKAVQHGLDEVIFLRMIQQESSWNPDARNTVTGCLGLGQLNPRFYTGWTEAQLLDPTVNLSVSAQTLATNLKLWGGSYFMALATYNFGIGNVLKCREEYGSKWIRHLPDETTLYVYNILPRARWGDWDEHSSGGGGR